MKRVKEFLSLRWDQKSPLLLGYSGGPDSKALLYALLDEALPLHIAHVDHGWRKESQQEAELIREEIASLKLPFHAIRLSVSIGSNLEDRFRKERFSFFKSLFQKIPFQSLLLAHQADDRAETVLKRFLEGAHLSFLGGMQEVAIMDGMPIWRPLLRVKKTEILEFLNEKSLSFFIDPTNRDTTYLRARFREEIAPFLTRSFGKNFVDNLALFSDRIYELQQYLDEKIAHCSIRKGEWGWSVHLQDLPRVEMRHLLQRRAADEGLTLPRTVLETILDWVLDFHKMRKIYVQSRWIVVFRGWVFILNSLLEREMFRKLVL